MMRTLLTVYALSFLVSAAIAQTVWRELPSPTPRDLRRLAFLDSARGWISGLEGTIFKTTNGGQTWQQQQSGTTDEVHEIFFLNDRLGYALSWTQFVDTSLWYGTHVLNTTNGGATWQSRQYPITGEYFSAIVFHDSLQGVMGGEFGRIVRTTNGGVTWIPAQVDSSPYSQWAVRRIKFHTPRYGYAMGGRWDIVGVVWRTEDGGRRWSAEGISPEPVRDLVFLDSSRIICVAGDLDWGASMVSTKNAGVLWEYRYLQIFGEPASLSFRTPREAWSPLGFAALFMTTYDTGSTWSLIETPRRRPIYDLAFIDSLVGYAVGDSGMILKYAPPTAVSEQGFLESSRFQLRQNYPNPFNPSTVIEFELPTPDVVSLRVFNLLGAEVKSILTNEPLRPGLHRFSLNASDLPSSTYFYQLTTTRSKTVRKMLVVR